MNITRRNILKMLGMGILTSQVRQGALSGMNFPAPPNPIPRMPLDEFVQSKQWVDSFRLGVKEMKKRKPSDPLSWFYQAAIHGVTDEAIQAAIKIDANVVKVLEKNVWNQCPHNGQNSANFLPWHRGYTYHFERILRLHTGMDSFSLPYWNYIDISDEEKRKFPREFGIMHLDGNLNNDDPDNINPLYLEERDTYFTNYEHANSEGLPLLVLSKTAVDISKPLGSPVFFGDTEVDAIAGGIRDIDPSTRGLLEKYPHDQIHRSVGGIVKTPNTPPGSESVGAMANPPTAAFDPIFSVHHSTIDWIWVQWSLTNGKTWGKIPSDDWFNDKPWIFIDLDGSFVNEPRKKYFDHRALGTVYKYENQGITPLALPAITASLETVAFKIQTQPLKQIAQSRVRVEVSRNSPANIKISADLGRKIENSVKTSLLSSDQRIILKLNDVQLGKLDGTGFDVHLVDNVDRKFSNTDDSFVGSIVLFSHSVEGSSHHMHGMTDANSQSFDVTNAIRKIKQFNSLTIVIVPFSLFEGQRKSVINTPLTIAGIEFQIQN